MQALSVESIEMRAASVEELAAVDWHDQKAPPTICTNIFHRELTSDGNPVK